MGTSTYRSKASETPVGIKAEPTYTYTETKVNRDSSGKITGAETTLYYSPFPLNYKPAAITKDGGSTWEYLNKPDGTPWIGADAQRSLETEALKTKTQQNIIESTTQGVGGNNRNTNFFGSDPPPIKPEEVKEVATSRRNQATTDPNSQKPTPDAQNPTQNGSDSGTSTGDSPPPESTANTSEATIASLPATTGKKSPVSIGSQRYYPLDIEKNENQDRIKFTAVEILDKGSIGGELKYTPVAGPVYLSIQSPISDQNSVDWGPGTMGPIEKAMFNAAYNGLQKKDPLSAVETSLGELAKTANAELQAVGAVGDAAIAAMAAGNINLFTRATSLALNPNLELLFNAPQLRPFAFSFLLTAREKGEAKTIKEIIKYFKYHMAVRSVDGNLFLKSPHVFFIEYQYGNGETHKSINLIAPEKLESKACALMNFSVDYTPLGTYMTYDKESDPEKTMVAYRLNMQFMEITPVYQKDYEDGPYADHPIGY